jgi:RimJ/RimL family protein N-acetyltransferase
MEIAARLQTERLTLRQFRPEDFDVFASFMADADVMRYLGGAPMTRAEAWRSLSSTIGHWTLRGYGLWAVVRSSDNALVGRVGMLNPEGWPGLEIAWTLGKPYWGKGYASEAATAAMGYAFLTQPVDRLISCIDPENKASQAVAERIGETRGERRELSVGTQKFPVDIWSISREEWRKRGR